MHSYQFHNGESGRDRSPTPLEPEVYQTSRLTDYEPSRGTPPMPDHHEFSCETRDRSRTEFENDQLPAATRERDFDSLGERDCCADDRLSLAAGLPGDGTQLDGGNAKTVSLVEMRSCRLARTRRSPKPTCDDTVCRGRQRSRRCWHTSDRLRGRNMERIRETRYVNLTTLHQLRTRPEGLGAALAHARGVTRGTVCCMPR